MSIADCTSTSVQDMLWYILTLVSDKKLHSGGFHCFCLLLHQRDCADNSEKRLFFFLKKMVTIILFVLFCLCVWQETLVPQCDTEMVCTWQGKN